MPHLEVPERLPCLALERKEEFNGCHQNGKSRMPLVDIYLQIESSIFTLKFFRYNEYYD